MAETSKSRLGKYELLLPPVGEGSEGFLYKACCVDETVPGVKSGEFVALKRLRHLGREMRPDRFQRQAELLRKLNHPGIVSYKDSFVWRDEESDEGPEVYCLVTEWLEGQSLKGLIEQHPGGCPWETAEKVLRQVLGALAYASTQRVVHRDLKPSNIYLLGDGKVKLIDFGIARPMDAEATTTSTTSNFEGTWNWMAPDFVRLQEDSFRGDERSDIYSFGICFYQVLTGRLPYGSVGENPQFAYFQRWLAPAPPKLMPHPNLNVLKGGRSCIQKCLEVDRDKRFQTFEEVLEAFDKIRFRQLRHAPEVYEYRRYLGQGGFGQVYRGLRLSDGRDIAVKELVAGQQARRFVREAKILQKAPHPHLVEYLDFVEVQASHVGDDPRYFLVLEYLEGMPGSSLRERIKSSTAELDPRELLVLFQGYLDCLEHLHQHEDRIIHRDIKPGNLYAPAGRPQKGKLFDLGIAHDEEGTRTHGQVPGTLDYMPPEFAGADSGRGSAQSDIYSLAVTLYEALTKSLPFPRLPSGEKAWVEYIARSLRPSECSFEQRVFVEHPELAALLRSALAYDPQQRYPSAKAMREEIQKILDSWDRVRLAFDAAIVEAQAAFARDDWQATEQHVSAALVLLPGNQTASDLLAQSRGRRFELLNAALALAQTAFEAKDFVAAQQHCEAALLIQPESDAAKQLLARLDQSKQELYEAAAARAQEAWEQKNYSEVQRQAEEALKLKPADDTAARLLASGREAEQRLQAVAHSHSAVVTIQIPDETWDHPIQLPETDEPMTAATAATLNTRPSTARPPTAQRTETSAQKEKKSESAPWEDWNENNLGAGARRNSWLRRRGWLLGTTVVALGVATWLGYRFYPRTGTVGSATRARRDGSATRNADDLDISAARNQLPRLLTNSIVRGDPILNSAFSTLPSIENLTVRDLTDLQSALARWWTNQPSANADLPALPLGLQLETRVRQEQLNNSFPGLLAALHILEDTSQHRNSEATSLAQTAAAWKDFGRKLNSAPEVAQWHEYSTSSNLFPRLVEHEFAQQLQSLLGGTNAGWTPSQYVQTFGSTKEEMGTKVALHNYRPPDRLGSLAKFKDDPNTAKDLREYAGAALQREVQAIQAIAQGSSTNSFSNWKANLETYRPLSPEQVTGLPSLSDLSFVERNLNDVALSSSRSGADKAAQGRLETLKTELATLQAEIKSILRAVQAGMLSQEQLAETGNVVAAKLRAIQNGIRAFPADNSSKAIREAQSTR